MLTDSIVVSALEDYVIVRQMWFPLCINIIQNKYSFYVLLIILLENSKNSKTLNYSYDDF